MKSLYVKIPKDIAEKMHDLGQINNSYIKGFITANLHKLDGMESPVEGLYVNYTMKVESDLHKSIKLKSITLDMTMTDLLARMFSNYYDEGDNIG